MIALTYEQIEKIELLDIILNSLTKEQIKEYLESEKIISILKGTGKQSPILNKLIDEHDMLAMDVGALKAEISNLKNDLQVLLKLVLKPNEYDSHSNAAALKSKYHVY